MIFLFTPVDLETINFNKGIHGYNCKEIEDFLEKITDDYEFLYRENRTLKEEIENLQVKLGQYQKMEDSLRNAVILAQKTGEDLKTSAQTEADLIIREAVQQGEQIKMKIRSEIQAELQNFAVLKNQVELFKCQFKSFLNGLLEIADHQFDLNEIWEDFHKSAADLKAQHSQTQNLAESLYKSAAENTSAETAATSSEKIVTKEEELTNSTNNESLSEINRIKSQWE